MSDQAGDDDPLLGEFSALREAVAEQLRTMARLEVALGQVQGEVARKTGPEAFKESFATIRQDVAGLAEAMARQEEAFRSVPDAKAIGVAVKDGVAGLSGEFAQTRRVVRDAAAAAQGAAELGRDAARNAADYARRLREALLSDRLTFVLTIVGFSVVGGLGLGTGWGLRGWWAPPPADVFARYMAAGNNPDWLLCSAGKRVSTDKGEAACELRIWLEKAGP